MGVTKKIEFTERGILLPPEIDDVTRRDFLKGSAGILVLGAAGCGGDGGDDTSGATRTFTDSRGVEVEVPDRAERIVAVHDGNAALPTLSLGLSLVGMPMRGGEFDPNIAEFYDLEGVEPIGEVYQPNLETIATLSPDLIVGEAFEGEATLDPGVVEALEEIAPTVFMDVFRPVGEVMADFARLYDVRGELEEQRAAYEERLRNFRDRLDVNPEDVRVSFMQFQAGGDVVTFGLTVSPLQVILTEVGFRWPEMVEQAEPDAFISLSRERLSDLDGDVIFWEALGEGNEGRATEARREEIETDPLFERLVAVEAGQAFETPARGVGGAVYDAYERTLDYLEGIFRDNEIDPNVFE